MAVVPAPDLSIVIPTHDTARMTLATVRAAIEESPPSTELIVVDDASTDGTTELLRDHAPSVRVIRLEENRRFAGAANAGVAASCGRIILLLNSDATLTPGAVSAMLAAFRADVSLGIAGARLLDPDGTPQWSGGRIPSLPWLLVMISGSSWMRPWPRRPRTGGDVDWVSGAAMAIRREAWDAVGPMPEHYHFYAQDLAFCTRARDAGWRVRLVADARVVHLRGASIRATRGNASLPYDPALLWLDLLTWGGERYGERWLTIALSGARFAAALRIAGRRLRHPFLRAADRDAARAITAVYSSARARLTRSELATADAHHALPSASPSDS